MRRGEILRILVLAVLAKGEAHGYEIRSRLSQMSQGYIKLSPGTLYPLLFILCREGLIEVSKVREKGRKKKVYRLTPKGREYLASRLNTIIEVMKSATSFLEDVARLLEDMKKEDYKPT
ncbi:MAG: PadR family transcriptional regulator [Thermoprotei archaeon]|nr:MAG: PadR family transcriptional regulator [Thermoprotei archaeon]RLF23884.1 MAG: PadR family transcriptional regulator [Thermoprotei archaeon]